MNLKPEELAFIFHTHFTFKEVTEDIRESLPAELGRTEELAQLIAQPEDVDIYDIVSADLTATPTRDLDYINVYYTIEFKDDARGARYFRATGNTTPHGEYIYNSDALMTFINDYMMDVIELSN